VTQQNASASEELASASQQMKAQAQQLKLLVSFFKVFGTTKNKTVTSFSEMQIEKYTKIEEDSDENTTNDTSSNFVQF
ncbi:MAG: hypothetical protein ABGW74_09160, partial [Campylobacterales bacterium]